MDIDEVQPLDAIAFFDHFRKPISYRKISRNGINNATCMVFNNDCFGRYVQRGVCPNGEEDFCRAYFRVSKSDKWFDRFVRLFRHRNDFMLRKPVSFLMKKKLLFFPNPVTTFTLNYDTTKRHAYLNEDDFLVEIEVHPQSFDDEFPFIKGLYFDNLVTSEC